MMGEKFSQELKPWLRGGLTRNWHVNVLKDVLKDDALSRMLVTLGMADMSNTK